MFIQAKVEISKRQRYEYIGISCSGYKEEQKKPKKKEASNRVVIKPSPPGPFKVLGKRKEYSTPPFKVIKTTPSTVQKGEGLKRQRKKLIEDEVESDFEASHKPRSTKKSTTTKLLPEQLDDDNDNTNG